LLRGQEVRARARGQIELLLKLCKRHGGREAARGERAERGLGAVYAKLIGPVVPPWVLVRCGGPCVAYSSPQAARRVRRQAPVLARVLPVPGAGAGILERLRQRLPKRCRAQRRGQQPAPYQLLLDPDRVSAQDEQQEEETELQAA